MMWPRVELVATLSLMKRALLANVVFDVLFSSSGRGPVSLGSSPADVRKETISPGLCPSNLKSCDRR